MVTMPEYVRSYAEGLMNEARYRFLCQVVTMWLEKLCKKHFMTKSNVHATLKPLSGPEIEMLEKNVCSFLQRVLSDNTDRSLHDEQVEESKTGDDDTSGYHLERQMNDSAEFDDYLCEESLDEEDEDFDDDDTSELLSENIEDEEEGDDDDDGNPFLKQLLDKQAGLAPPSRSRHGSSHAKSMKRDMSQMSISRRLSRALTRRKATKMVKDQRVHSNEWAELDKAQKTLNQNLKLAKPRVSLIVEQTIDAMTRKSSMAAKIKNAESAEEKARLHWRKVFNLVIERQNS